MNGGVQLMSGFGSELKIEIDMARHGFGVKPDFTKAERP